MINTGRRECQVQCWQQILVFCGIWCVTKLHFTTWLYFVTSQTNLKMTPVRHVVIKPVMKHSQLVSVNGPNLIPRRTAKVDSVFHLSEVGERGLWRSSHGKGAFPVASFLGTLLWSYWGILIWNDLYQINKEERKQWNLAPRHFRHIHQGGCSRNQNVLLRYYFGQN